MSKKANTRERLIEAAGALFAERGFDGASVRDITAKAGVNLGSVTYHFGSKEDLFGAVLIGRTAALRAQAEIVVASGRSPESKLRALLEVLARQVMHRDPGLRIMFTEVLASGRRLPRTAVASIQWRNRVFREIVEEGVRAGEFRRCDAECLAWNFFGMLTAYILYHPMIFPGEKRTGFSKATTERVVDAALDVFLNGLRTRPRAMPRAAVGRRGRRGQRGGGREGRA